MSYKFKCDVCKCETLEEVLVGVVQYSKISAIDIVDGSIVCDYDSYYTEAGDTQEIYYQCAHCGKEVTREQIEKIVAEETARQSVKKIK
jgi:hypothetical protein